jgi:hypothetical protein
MDCSGNQNGRCWQDLDGRRQRQWATAAQWAAEQQNNCDGHSGVMGGDARWMAAGIMMESVSKIPMDGGSGDGQKWHNGW